MLCTTKVIERESKDGLKYAVSVSRPYETFDYGFFLCEKIIESGTRAMWGYWDKNELPSVCNEYHALWTHNKKEAENLAAYISKMDLPLIRYYFRGHSYD